MDGASREMTLREWLWKLPESHSANKEFRALEARIRDLETERDRLQYNLDTAQAALCAAADALSNGDAEEAHKFLSRQKAYDNALAWRRELEAKLEAAEADLGRLQDHCARQGGWLQDLKADLAAAREELDEWRERVAEECGPDADGDDTEIGCVVAYIRNQRERIAELEQDLATAERCHEVAEVRAAELEAETKGDDGTGAIGLAKQLRELHGYQSKALLWADPSLPEVQAVRKLRSAMPALADVVEAAERADRTCSHPSLEAALAALREQLEARDA